jgi:hypothetical protein
MCRAILATAGRATPALGRPFTAFLARDLPGRACAVLVRFRGEQI